MPTSWMEGAALKIFLAFVTIFKPAPYTYVGSVRALTFKKISTSNFSVSFFVFVFVIFFSSHTLYFHYFFVSVILVVYYVEQNSFIAFFYLEAKKFFSDFFFDFNSKNIVGRLIYLFLNISFKKFKFFGRIIQDSDRSYFLSVRLSVRPSVCPSRAVR